MSLCPSCGEANADPARFCSACGARLTAEGAGPEARKTVTVLFCDVVGSTAMGEAIDTEILTGVMARYFDRMRAVIRRHGGTVEKFIGDAVVAVFGYPTVHEDDALRAVRAGAEMRAELEALDQELSAEAGITLQTRTGINTGEVLVGALAPGSNFAAGDVMNTAARLEQAAEPGQILLGAGTWRLVREAVDVEPIEPAEVKGKAEAVPAWALSGVRPGGEMLHRRLDAPLVGRDIDLALLRSTLEKAIREATVELVTIVGEPGVGKTRLVRELHRIAAEQLGPDVRWREGRCLPYGEGVTFWALGEIVKSEAGILENEPPDRAATKIDELITGGDADAAWLRQRLRPLLGLDAPQAGRDENFTAWRMFLERLAEDRPSVFVFEDMHWADDALLAFVEHLAEYAEGVPMLILATTRPELLERAPSWAASVRDSTRVRLSPLTALETARLVGNLLESAVLDPDLEAAIVERAGGNPLFTEELVRLLIEQGVLTKTVTWTVDQRATIEIPPAVESVIAARLDTLSPDRRRLLQDAAVIGEVFWSGAVVAMGPLEETEARQALHELSRKGLIRAVRKSSMAGHAQYAFSHALVRDVCYSQIPKARRSERHRRAVEWIESVSGERVEDHAEIVAAHYLTALEFAGADADRSALSEKAMQYLIASGDRALGLDTAKAEASYAKALELAPEGSRARAVVMTGWGDALRHAGRYNDAAAVLDKAASLLREHQDVLQVGRCLTLLANVLWQSGSPRSHEAAVEAIDLLEPHPGPELIAAYNEIARLDAIAGREAQAIEWADRSLALAASLGLPEPVKALGYKGMCRATFSADGLPDLRRALSLAIDRGEGFEASTISNNLAMSAWPYDGPQASLVMWQECIDFSERRGLEPLVSASATINSLFALGRWDEALEVSSTVGERLEAFGMTMGLATARAMRARILTLRGYVDDAAPLGEWALEAVRSAEAIDYKAFAYPLTAFIRFCSNESDGAKRLLAELVELPDIDQPNYADALREAVTTALGLGEPDLADRLIGRLHRANPLNEHARCGARAMLAEARGALEEAVGLYGEAESRWDAFGVVPDRAFALLGQGRCLLALGRAAEAVEPLRMARGIFADLLATPALRETDLLLEGAGTPASTASS